MSSAAPHGLQVIRGRLDAIDEQMHRLLIQRSGITDELIGAKETIKLDAAFRPDREADMTRRMVVRHHGSLPLLSVEHIWREIITAFTALQAPVRIIVGPSADAMAMRDLVRFYFGFSVPVTATRTTGAALAELSGAGNQLAVISAEGEGRWWAPLLAPEGPKVFAKLPFIETVERSATVPAYVIGPRLQEASAPDVQLLSIRVGVDIGERLSDLGGRLVALERDEWLVEIPVGVSSDDLIERLGGPAGEVDVCGGFAQPIRILTDKGLQGSHV